MPSLIKLSEASVLGLHALAYLALAPGAPASSVQLARACQASPHHMVKVCQRLARAGLLATRRGVGGGFLLKRPPQQVSLLEVVDLFEGPLDADGCLPARAQGRRGKVCLFGPGMARLQRQAAAYLSRTRLSDLARRCRSLGVAPAGAVP